jgi:hypothetical protein
MRQLDRFATWWMVAFTLTFSAVGVPAATTYYVSLSGKDSSAGTTRETAFRTIRQAVSVLQSGDTIVLRKGVHVVPANPGLGPQDAAGSRDASNTGVLLQRLSGVTITSDIDEHAYIDGTYEDFRRRNTDLDSDWVRAVDSPEPSDRDGARPDEWVSRRTYVADGMRGAFLDRNPYTRLISYSRLEDLRADNQTFPISELFSAGTTDILVVERCKKTATSCPNGYTIPSPAYGRRWVYMGPGIWYNKQSQRIHIRLAPTNHDIKGLSNYIPSAPDSTGSDDPRLIPLAITPDHFTTLFSGNTNGLTIKDVSIRYGGEYTMEFAATSNTTIQSARIFSASYGVRTEAGTIPGETSRRGNMYLAITNTVIDGGKPTWYFRSDRKSEYVFLNPVTGEAETNNLGKNTSLSLFRPSPLDIGTIISYSELKHGHDLYLSGSHVQFMYNWINDMNDEALILDYPGGTKDNPIPNEDVRVHHNVFNKTVNAISFGNDTKGTGKNPVDTGKKYVYRNIVDLRGRILYTRPQHTAFQDVWAYGDAFKMGGYEPPIDLFQNTFLVYNQTRNETYQFYQTTSNNERKGFGSEWRRSFNNIFVAVNPSPESDNVLMVLPQCGYPAATDGNNYFRIGFSKNVAFTLHEKATCNDELRLISCRPGKTFIHFCTLGDVRASQYVQGSTLRYSPGYEASSIETDPMFVRIGADGVFRESDDLRLGTASNARAKGIVLPDQFLRDLDAAGPTEYPNIGAYRDDSALCVGVNRSRIFPDGLTCP